MSDKTTSQSQLRSAYNRVMESGVTYFWDRTPIPGVNPDDPQKWYRRAWDYFQGGEPIQAERWARAASHLATALWHEAKLAWLSRPASQLPSLERADLEGDYHLHESPEETQSRLSVLVNRANQIRSPSDLLTDVKRMLGRAQTHLDARNRQPRREGRSPALPDTQQSPPDSLELIQAERLKAANEYGLCLDCLITLAEGQRASSGVQEMEKAGPAPRRSEKKRGEAA